MKIEEESAILIPRPVSFILVSTHSISPRSAMPTATRRAKAISKIPSTPLSGSEVALIRDAWGQLVIGPYLTSPLVLDQLLARVQLPEQILRSGIFEHSMTMSQGRLSFFDLVQAMERAKTLHGKWSEQLRGKVLDDDLLDAFVAVGGTDDCHGSVDVGKLTSLVEEFALDVDMSSLAATAALGRMGIGGGVAARVNHNAGGAEALGTDAADDAVPRRHDLLLRQDDGEGGFNSFATLLQGDADGDADGHSLDNDGDDDDDAADGRRKRAILAHQWRNVASSGAATTAGAAGTGPVVGFASGSLLPFNSPPGSPSRRVVSSLVPLPSDLLEDSVDDSSQPFDLHHGVAASMSLGPRRQSGGFGNATMLKGKTFRGLRGGGGGALGMSMRSGGGTSAVLGASTRPGGPAAAATSAKEVASHSGQGKTPPAAAGGADNGTAAGVAAFGGGTSQTAAARGAGRLPPPPPSRGALRPMNVTVGGGGGSGGASQLPRSSTPISPLPRPQPLSRVKSPIRRPLSSASSGNRPLTAQRHNPRSCVFLVDPVFDVRSTRAVPISRR